MSRFLLALAAASLGAAQGLPETTRYTLVYLVSHPERPQLPREEGQRIQGLHLAHLRSLFERGEVVAAGPIATAGSKLRGIVIFKTPSAADALALASADPAVEAKLLAVEVRPWSSFKGIGEEYAKMYRADPKMATKMRTFQLIVFRRGPNWGGMESPELPKLGKEHLDVLVKLRGEGKLALAGPYADLATTPGGVFVLKLASIEEARAIAEADPLVKAGWFLYDLYDWMCEERVMP